MHITLTKDYSVKADTTLLGYQGETNSRKITFSGLVVDGCDLYKLQILYSDGKVYELPIQDEVVTITGSILREIGYVSCQILGYSVSGSDYTIVFKSNIFELEIKEAIDGEVAPIPPYEEATGALEKILAGVEAAMGYAGSAETSADRAETARTEAVTAQNNAKISADLAASAAQQTTADKTATAGYAKTAKTNADSTAADRQAVQTLAEQVTADKATVADHAAKVAEDRTAAETAAQTAQSIADSLPDDYVTAVGKIAENTAEIGRVKLTDKELQRRVNALYDLGNGVTHQFETDSETAYAKTIPTGGRLMSIKSIGGKNLVFNQLADVTDIIDETFDFYYKETLFNSNRPKWAKRHKYLFEFYVKSSLEPFSISIGYSNKESVAYNLDGASFSRAYGGRKLLLFTPDDSVIDNGYQYIGLRPVRFETQRQCIISVKNLMIFDLTAMFGSGNEPTTAEEFEKMFPNGYYPYNEGELMSMSVNNVVEQGKNLFDCYGFSCISILNVNGERKLNNSYGTTISTIEPTNKIVVTQSQAPESVIAHVNNGWFCVGIKGMEQSKRYTFSFDFTTTKMLIQNPVLQILVNGRFPGDAINISELNVKKRVSFTFEYTKFGDRQYIELRLSGMSGIFENFQLDEGSTATAYTPYHTPISYTIPEAIRNLPGYGVEGNVADYETKTYTQNNAIDGTEIKALDTPIVTDVSNLIPDDFLRNIEVEAGGSITFKNSNGDSYRIPVPSEEEYIVKLSEVGGTT